MTSVSERIQDAERRLARIEALQQMLATMAEELAAYRAALDLKLGCLQERNNNTTPAPAPNARPAPKPTPTRASPTAHGSSFPTAQGVSPEAMRAAPRRKGNPVPVMISNAGGTMDSFQGWVLDRSSGGLRVLVDQPVTVGTQLSVKPSKAHAGFPWIPIEIRSCQPERSSYALGVQFVEKPSWNELQAFG